MTVRLLFIYLFIYLFMYLCIGNQEDYDNIHLKKEQ
jgi:hypothetical protein